MTTNHHNGNAAAGAVDRDEVIRLATYHEIGLGSLRNFAVIGYHGGRGCWRRRVRKIAYRRGCPGSGEAPQGEERRVIPRLIKRVTETTSG